MNGTEIINILCDNLEAVSGCAGPVAGALFTAIFLRHNTAAKEFEKVKVGRLQELANELLASGKMSYTEYFKANNFLKVAKIADEISKNADKAINSKEYDFDWFIRFYEAVGNVSDNDMQMLWAKILSGEITCPSSYSLKTIDILKNMSRRDAEQFMSFCSHAFLNGDSLFIPNEEEYIEYSGLNYIDIMHMNELGLLHKDATIHLDIELGKEEKVIIINRELALILSSSDEKKRKKRLNMYPFTVAGNEIASLISIGSLDKDFIKYGKTLSKDSSVNVKIKKIKCINGDRVELEEENLLSDI